MTGRPDALKASQVYPYEFVEEALDSFAVAFESDPLRPLKLPKDISYDVQTHDLWLDVKPEEMAAWMEVPYDRLVVG